MGCRPRHRPMTKKQALVATTLVVVLAVVVLALVLGNRTAGDRTAERTGDASAGVASDSGGSTSDSAVAEAPGTAVRQAADTTPMTRAVISTGQVTLHARDMAHVRAEVVRL